MAEYVIQDPGWQDMLRAYTQDDFVLLVEDIADDARHACPVDTGELVDTIETHYPAPGIGIITVGTDHWAPTEYGSAPHPIDAHGPYSLHNAETGEYFGPHVNHPGTPAQPFMRPALWKRRVRP